jgi:SAM-dependent methyltransferase
MIESHMDLFHGLAERIDFRPDIRTSYESRVASMGRVLDVGGRNHRSKSHRRLRKLSSNPNTQIVATDILAAYGPDLVDDICRSSLRSETFDGIYCDAILEHVRNYPAAVTEMHRILKPGGELFVYVPFFWCIHDRMDYHRFTFSELDRLLSEFEEYRIFLPDEKGYGGVLWQLLTFYRIKRCKRLWRQLSRWTNAALAVYLRRRYRAQRNAGRLDCVSFVHYRFYYTHFVVNHGFCGWARKARAK